MLLRIAAPLSAGLLAFTLPQLAEGDVTHVVQPGHTLEAISHRYHVSEQAIIEANHLKEPRHLRPGQTLLIPGVEPARKADRSVAEVGGSGVHENTTHAQAGLQSGPRPRGRRTPGVVELDRAGDTVRIRVRDGRGHVPAAALEEFERAMRQGSETHPPDPRLVALVGIVSDHFAGKPLQVVSGFRAYTPTQYTPHSNHNYGKALDFRVLGIDSAALYDFCLTLRNVGCGYYPKSSFVHLDVRDAKAHWIDRSGPGEPPLYDKPEVPADESRADVPEDRTGTAPTPALPPPSSSGSPSTQDTGFSPRGDQAL